MAKWNCGAQLRHRGVVTEVIEDRGDTILLAIPPSHFRSRGGDYLSLAASRTDVSKADIVLEQLELGELA